MRDMIEAGARSAQNAGGFLAAGSQAADSLPGWNLTDLYPNPKGAIKADIEKAASEAAAFKSTYEGKLDKLARESGAGLAEAIKAYEALSDLTGRIGSYAVLNYATNTADPERAKLLGDCQDKLTSIGSQLLFFELELNKIDD